MSEIGPKANIVLNFVERLVLTDAVSNDAKKAKDKPNLSQKIDQNYYGKGDKLSTPEKDKRANEPTPPQESLPDAIKQGLQLAFLNAGLDGQAFVQNPRYAYGKAVAILAARGLCPMEALQADAFEADAKSATFAVGKNNPDCTGNPIPTNLSVTMSWESPAFNRYSVHAEIK